MSTNRLFSAIVLLYCALVASPASGQQTDSLPSPFTLKKLTLEELMNIEVMSVSKRPEKLGAAPSAIQVITQKDIKNSGAKTLAEALRLASNLQVAQVNASQWAISARGFNNVLANKLLVLIDGRTVYTPLYAGVFWDVQNLLLEDVDRIEVISGPGGTLWGANAVNGVINIITKNAGETQGAFIEAATGTELVGMGSVRYGGKFSKINYRVYGTGFKMANTLLDDNRSAGDEWSMLQGGFRMDWDASAKNKVSLQGSFYSGDPNPDGGAGVKVMGDNITARWTHTGSERSDFQLQAYYDHTWRDFRNGFTEDLKTYDMDWQQHFLLGQRHKLTYGTGLRLMDHTVTNLALFRFLPARKTLSLYSAFVQDEVMLIKDRLRFTIGTKIEHNSYTGFEYQPGGRIAWTPNNRHAIWGAVSRAVRTPSRIDRDFYLNITPAIPISTGGNFISEELLAYELGWRLQPHQNLTVSLASFYNIYDNIRSAEPGPPPLAPFPITIANGVKGTSYGIELSAMNQLTTWWNIKAGYTFMKKNLSVKSTSRDMNRASAESNDPKNQFLLQSNMNLPGRVELGAVLRYVDNLPEPRVPNYIEMDMRLGWKAFKFLELNIVGQNLFDNHHPEFIPSSPSPRKLERSIYGKIICSF